MSNIANYQRFNNSTTEVSDSQSHPFQANARPPIVAGPTSFLPAPKKELKSWGSLKTLVRLELALALLMIMFEAIMDGTMSNLQTIPLCTLGTGVWVGVLGVIAASLGMGAFRSPYGNKCLTVASFVMTIISVIVDGILIIMSSICMVGLPYLMRSTYAWDAENRRSYYKEPTVEMLTMARGLIAVESFMILAAAVHMISGIVLTGFICRNWCQGSEPDVAVVYVAGTNPGAVENEATDPYRIALPAGAKYVIFVQTGARSQAEQPQPEFRNLPGGSDGKII